MNQITDWLTINWVETIAALLGLIGIYLQIKQNPWYWFSALIMVLMYIFVFYQAGFYADMSFQFYYLIVSIYGWTHWVTSRGKADNESLIVYKLSKSQWIIALLVSIIFFAVIYFILDKYTNSQVAIGDAFTTALSITATWLLARKILENWLFWIIVDVVSTGLYFYKGLFPSAILFTVLTVLAIVGYIKWRKATENV